MIEMLLPRLKVPVVTVLDSASIISKNHTRTRKLEMKTSHLKSLLLTLCFVLLLISCGSSSGGIGGSGMTSQGSVSEFGSIFVNGTEFDTSNATIIVEGEEKGVGDAHCPE